MKVTFDIFTTALCSYIDSDIIAKLPNNKRFLMGVAVMAIPLILSKKVNDYSDILCTLGVIDEENCIDVDNLEEVATKLMNKYGCYQFKLMDLLVDVKEDDILKLCAKCRTY